MSAGRMRARRMVLRWWVVAAVLISIVGLAWLIPAPVAFAASGGAASGGAASVSAGDGVSCAIESGKAYCWGYGELGGLGDDRTADSSVPVAVDTSGVLAGKALTQITAGTGYACALDSTGAAYCWGNNQNGQLGDGNTADSSIPVAVDASGVLAGKTLTQITASDGDTCALDSNGAGYCWGRNHAGQLGDDTTTDSSVPVAVDTSGLLDGKTLTQITNGYQYTCALDSTGAAYCWGYNAYGSFGDGNTFESSTVPVAVDTSGVLAGKALTQITAGEYHTCALDSTGAAYCWGSNEYSQLGDGNTAFDSSIPVAVDSSGLLAGKTLTQITAGGFHTCALASTGDAYCWGYDGYGQLGDGITGGPANVPVAVDTSGVLAGNTLTNITGGYDNTCAADAARAVYCWGDNSWGDLGDDTSAPSNVPVLAGPEAPAGVTAVAGDTAAIVSWIAPPSLDTGTLMGYTATAVPGNEACTTTGATTCTITGLTDGTTYSVSVVAHTTVGDSGASTPATVTPEATGRLSGPIVSGIRKTKCIDDNGDSRANDTKIVMWDCNGTPEQNWTIEPDGTIRINRKCMDIYRDQKGNKAQVDLWTCTGRANQQWHPDKGALVNPVSHKCLDDPRFNTTDGTQLEIYTCDGGRNQQWKLPRAVRN
jgi:alpha-tubulin suppressor-like RCC1 family protein